MLSRSGGPGKQKKEGEKPDANKNDSALLCEDAVGFLQRFLGTDVEPEAGHLPGVNRDARVKPLHKTARLVRVVAFGNVLVDEREHGPGIIVERDAGQGAGRVFGLLLK